MSGARRHARPAVSSSALHAAVNLLRNTNGGRLTADTEVVHRDHTTLVGVRVCDEDDRRMPRSAMPVDR